ncbi:hypothetical protein CspHIS471_0510490 [Cutaneotrichosporon sp. HIS471]|nr:hypothetical protein CspHIS471_0510490 [Cutaneotrichosporon sp. HIS471]
MKAVVTFAFLCTARAGYITVGINEARQCNTSLVEWYGDDGPYHLLLTPTQFRQEVTVPLPTNTDQSSSKTKGNTTLPPTMFGIIPLGNSFNIPITYADDVKFADDLAPQSLSDHPSTWTQSGVTYMNWTVGLAKGTRFILVAGMGDEWASGGSSEMMTVGQGGFDCFGNDPKPSVTAGGYGLERPISLASLENGRPSHSPSPRSPVPHSPRWAGSSPAHSPSLYDPPGGYALERPTSFASLDSGRVSPALPPGAAPPMQSRSPMGSPRPSFGSPPPPFGSPEPTPPTPDRGPSRYSMA